MIKKVAFIAHPTRDMQRAKEFFGDTLGLECSADYGDMWAEYDAEVERLKGRGVDVVMDVWSNEHEGKLICKMAVIRDPDGNPMMLHEIADWRAAGGQADFSGGE